MNKARGELKVLGAALAAARDWDVFTGQTITAVGAAFPDEPGFDRLVAAAERRRAACHAALRAYLAGADYRRLGLSLASLASLSPWQNAGEGATASLEDFAAASLSRSLRRLLRAGPRLDSLSDQELHAIRLRAKRLRYAAEMFAPLFSRHDATRMLRRLASLQECLGALNDTAVLGRLLDELGRGAGQGYAAGLIRGYKAAGTPDARQRIGRAWRRLRHCAPFWR
jgi:triphosphatase